MNTLFPLTDAAMYGLIADLIAVLHGAVAAYLLSMFLFSTLLGRDLPFWYTVPSIPMLIIALPSYIFLHDCPINPVERYFRELAGQEVFSGSFLLHHLQNAGIRLDGSLAHIFELSIGFILGILLLDICTRILHKRSK